MKEGINMKGSTLKSFRMVAAAAVLFVPLSMSVAVAQEAQPMAPPNQQAVPQSSLSPQQLDNLVAPLALYPDPLLSQVLVAATYPLEVVEANQWLQQNRGLTGTALTDAAKQQNWDPSVQALVAFPDVLVRLNQDVRWTTDLGNAFLGQQADVMAAIQRLRARAQANGKLQTTPQETVTTQTENGQSAISIQPADPQVIYVPTYDPTYVWGPPAWGYYPPLYYPTYGFGFGFGIPFGGLYAGWGGWGGWGWGCNWFGGGLYVNGAFFGRYGYRYGGYGAFGGSRAWAHNYSRSSVATGHAGYSRSYNTAGNSRGFNSGANGRAAGNYRSGAAGSNYRSGAAGNSYRGSTANSYRGSTANSYRGSTANSYRGSTANSYRGSTAQSYSRGYAGQSAARSYSAPSRSYSAPSSRSYSAPSRSYSGGGGGGFRSGGGGGFHGGGGGGGSHGGGGRR